MKAEEFITYILGLNDGLGGDALPQAMWDNLIKKARSIFNDIEFDRLNDEQR